MSDGLLEMDMRARRKLQTMQTGIASGLVNSV